MNNKCAPGKNFKDGTCFTLEDLIDISEHFNNRFPNLSFPIKKDKKYLLKHLTSKMKNKYNCNDQMCWINTNFIKSMKNTDITHFTFRPNGPKGKYDWLSTSDINKVMNQYENKYTDFKFLGAVPYDFEDLPYYEAHNLNINDLKMSGKKRIGMVINLDTHDKSGSHWVAFYSDLNKKNIYYFDSFAKKPGDNIYKFSKKFNNYFGSNNNIEYNKKKHQYKNSECGVYSMNFIIRLLNGETFENITQNITRDVEMNACRRTYFNKN